MSKFATVFARFHSNRLLKTLTDGIFVFKSKQQCLLPKKSKFVALLTNLEISPAHCPKVIQPKCVRKTLKLIRRDG